jgi:hypothetical protein
MNILNEKKAIIALTIIWAIITFNLIKTTYAKYITTLDTNASISISRWNISLNDNILTSQKSMNNILELTFPGDEFTQSNVIVPGSTGYFDLNIDSSNTTVPFSITVLAELNSQSALTQDFIISGYSVNDGNIISLADVSTFTYNIDADIDTTEITVYMQWQDDGLDSAIDTSVGIAGGNLLFDVNLCFEQIIE